MNLIYTERLIILLIKFIISNFQIKHVELYLEFQSIKYYIFFF